MRIALASLTGRGRAFLAGGVTVVVAAWVTGQDTVVRIGVLLVLLVVLSAFWVARTRQDLTLERTMSPPVVGVGQPSRIELTLTNVARTATGVLLIEEQVPHALGTRPRFVLEALPHNGHRTAHYTVRSDVRGRHQVGPLLLRVTDPFGLVELPRWFQQSAVLTVTPRVVALAPIALGGARQGVGDNRPRAFASGSAEDVTVREYRLGDDLRRVHWRSSAKTGELMVRREEQPWQSRATIYLDNRAVAHRGRGATSTLETAVSVAASVAVHLSQRGFSVRLVTASGREASHDWHALDEAASTQLLLEELAVVDTSAHPHPDAGWLGEPGQGGLVVAVLGAVTDADGHFLSRLARHGAESVAVQLDVNGWYTSPRTADTASPVLRGAGLRAVLHGPHDRIETSWRSLARSASLRPVLR